MVHVLVCEQLSVPLQLGSMIALHRWGGTRVDEAAMHALNDLKIAKVDRQLAATAASHSKRKKAKAATGGAEAAPAAEVEDAIRSGGLAATKTARIHSILHSLQAERGEVRRGTGSGLHGGRARA